MRDAKCTREHMNQRDTLFVKDGQLNICSFKATDLAGKFGTPLYVMDGNYIEEVCLHMIEAVKSYGDGAVAYASKAFATIATTKLMNKLGMWFDAVSGGELYLLRSAGVDPKRIIFHGNAKTVQEIVEGVESGVGLFVIDSTSEIDRLDKIAGERGAKQDVLIRINPLVSAHTHTAVQTAAPMSKFGFDIQGNAIDYIKDIISRQNLCFKGLHIHIGSQIYDHSAYEIAVDKIAEFVRKLHDDGIDVDVVDLGGGYGVYYFGNDPKFTPARYAYTIKNLLFYFDVCLRERGLGKPFVIIEPGRSIVGEAGVTLYTVNAIKNFEGVKKYVAIDGGMFENPRHALYGSQYTAVVCNKADMPKTDVVTIAGKCCESGDVISTDVPLQKAEVGDVVAVFTTGAYNYSMASNYNLNPVPPVVLVKDDQAELIVKGQSYEDMLRNNIVPEWI